MKLILLKVNQFLLFFVLISVCLYFGKSLLVPLAFAIMLAMLLTPLANRLEKSLNRVFSCLIPTLIILFLVALMMWVIGMQVSSFAGDIDEVKSKVTEGIQTLQSTFEEKTGIPPEKADSMIAKQKETLASSQGSAIKNSLGYVASFLTGLVLSLVFTFLILFNRERYHKFFLKAFPNTSPTTLKKTLDEIAKVSQQYLVGRAFSMSFLFVLFSIALLVIGLKNAILLAAIASLLTIIPYVGSILGCLFPIAMAFMTESTETALWVTGGMIAIQAIDNYFVEPYFIGGEVRLSALATIFSILAGGMVWGIAGMILFIPLFSILKIIFDHTPELKPFGLLIGDEGKPPSSKLGKLFGKR